METTYSGERQLVLRTAEGITAQEYIPPFTPVKLRDLTFADGVPVYKHNGVTYRVARTASGWSTTGVIL